MRISFFRTPLPKQFDYKPRFYDEFKEEAENRRKRIEAELKIESAEGQYTGMNKGIMAQKIRSRRKANKNSTIRLLVIILILLLLVFLLVGDLSTFKESGFFSGFSKLFSK